MLLTSGREGLLVAPPDEASAFAVALGHLLGSPDERERMGAEGRVTATTRYSWVSVAAELEAYYQELRGEVPAQPAPAGAEHDPDEAPAPV
jgi:glycosyltransferase involved in cell wall biosynthesis